MTQALGACFKSSNLLSSAKFYKKDNMENLEIILFCIVITLIAIVLIVFAIEILKKIF